MVRVIFLFLIKKIMKTLSIFLMLFVLVSCIKYEDGPKFSFLTKEKRLLRTWELTRVDYFIGADSSYVEGEVYPFSLEFKENNSLKYKTTINGNLQEISSTWDWHLDTWGLTLDLTENISSNNGIRNYQILRLSKKELWIYDRAAGHKFYFKSE
jgi:hypothetical protein